MAPLRGLPPGRAGKLWLEHRLEVAHRAGGLLDQKLRILRGERQRLELLTRQTGEDWEQAGREAAGSLVLTLLLDGERAIRLEAAAAEADVVVEWEQSMGVRFPASARCTVPAADPDTPPVGGAALVAARAAHRRALATAVEHAAACAALAVIQDEERSTRRRLRAIENRWVPRLEDAAAQLRVGLEEREHAEAVRLRWAKGREPGRAGRGTAPGEVAR